MSALHITQTSTARAAPNKRTRMARRPLVYRNELRLWLNLYLPSVKLLKKVRVGSKVRRVYDGPRTPFERVKACPQADRERVARLEELRKSLDPFQLGKCIERKLLRISRLANRRQRPRAGFAGSTASAAAALVTPAASRPACERRRRSRVLSLRACDHALLPSI